MLQGNMSEHFDQIIGKIKAKENFGLIRPSDGEYHILINKTLTNCDDWTFTSGDILCDQLRDAVQSKIPNLFIGIPCNNCCNKKMFDDYLQIFNVDVNRLTYANIFCNNNWKRFIEFIKQYSDGFYFVGPGRPNFLNMKGIYEIDLYLVNNWNKKHQSITTEVIQFASSLKNELVLFSAGPLSKIWIPLCMKNNPDNIYLDIGSVFDLFIKGKTNRFYVDENDALSKQVCQHNLNN